MLKSAEMKHLITKVKTSEPMTRKQSEKVQINIPTLELQNSIE